MSKYFLAFILFFATLKICAQDFGAYKPSAKWNQVNTDTARIIFTPEVQKEGERIAAIIHKMAAEQPASIGSSLKKINVVLHSNTALANGYVALAPRRSEYYLVPGSNIFEFGNLPWYEHLAVHEYRHVQQYNNFNNGLSKAMYYLFGQQGQLLANALSVPDWFFEGDAVYAETAFTKGGRGRTPYFWNPYKSLWAEGKNYSWMKLRNGSYKDFVPNHYYLGYLLSNYGYLKYGPDFWQKVTKDASAFKGLVYPFQQAVKKYSGISYKEFRNNALQFYKQQITTETAQKKNNYKTVVNEIYPQFISADSIVYLKTGYDRLDAFYIKDKKGDHRLEQKMIGAEDWFSYRNGEIVYTAYAVDKRYSLTDYNDIVLLDLATKHTKRITEKAKYFSPDLSPDGIKIVAIFMNDSLISEIHVLDKSGSVKQRISLPNGFAFQTKFIDDNRIVYGWRATDETITLRILDLKTGQSENIITPTENSIGFATVVNNKLYFTEAFNGNDELFSYDLNNKNLVQLTAGQTGNYFASVFGDQLLYAHYTASGYQLQQRSLAETKNTSVSEQTIQQAKLPFPVAGQYKNIMASPTRNFPVTHYKKSTGLLNIHSWSPDYEDPEFDFRIFSDNILNNFSNEIYYRYNQNEQSHTAGFTTTYGGLFPLLTAGFDYTANRHIKTISNELVYNQFEARAGYSIPLNFTFGKTYKFLNFGTNAVWNRLLPGGRFKDSLETQDVSYLHHFISWRQQLPRAVQQIYPRLGYYIAAEHRHQLQRKGYQFLSNTAVFLPSPIKNNSLVLTGYFQQTDTNNVVFSNRFANSSGYRDYYFSRMWRASANYHFPIIYPDKGVANIVYFLRMRGNVFYNYTKVYSKDKSRSTPLRSTGFELLFDSKWWNQLEIPFGIRYSYLLDKELTGTTNRSHWELVIPIDLIPN